MVASAILGLTGESSYERALAATGNERTPPFLTGFFG